MLEIISKSMSLNPISFGRTKWIWMFAPSLRLAEMNCNRACAQSLAIPKRNLQHGGAVPPSIQVAEKGTKGCEKYTSASKNCAGGTPWKLSLVLCRTGKWVAFCLTGKFNKEASPRAVFSCNTCELCCCRCGTLGNGLILCWFDEWLSECGTGLDYFEFSPFSAKYLTTCTVV